MVQATGVHSIDNCVALLSTIGGLQWPQGLLVFSLAFPGLAARDQGRQWWTLEPVVCTLLAAESAVCIFAISGLVVNTHIVMEPGQVARAGANYRLTGNCGGPVSVLSCGFPLLC